MSMFSKEYYYYLGTAVVTLVALGSYFLCIKHYYGEKLDDNPEYLELLLEEEKGLLHASSISSVTFYQGDITKSFDIAERVQTIILKNPWLASRLVYHTINGEKRLFAKYPKQLHPGFLFHYYVEPLIMEDDETFPIEDDSWESINQKLKTFTVKRGVDCIHQRYEKLFQVTVIRKFSHATGEVTNSILVVSLSHVLGDGHTFYSLYTLLDPRTPSTAIPSFIAKRIMDFPQRIDEIYGKEFQQYLQSIPFLMSKLITLLFSGKPTITLFNINDHIIQTIKQNYLKQNQQEHQLINSSLASKLSTNDVITSWYFRTCGCDIGIVTVDYRGKLEDYTHQHAGNYSEMVFYSRSDYQSALDIRQSLVSFKSNSNTIPSFYTTLKYRFSCISNWATFYHHLVFPTTIHRVHLPLYDLSNVIFRDLAIIFAPREDELSLCVLTRNDLPSSKLFQSSGFLTPWKNKSE